MSVYDWDLFHVEIDDEGQQLYTVWDNERRKHWLDGEDAAILLDRLNGHCGPSALSESVDERQECIRALVERCERNSR